MFLTYLWRELRRRARQALFIALGLALGVGLVITVTAASSGVKNAQGTVLHSLYGIGTDITVSTPAAQGSGGPSRFLVGGGLPTAGSTFSKHLLLSASTGLGPLAATAVPGIRRLPHVSAAAGALVLTNLDVSGTMPSIKRNALRRPDTSINTSSFSVLGVDLAAARVGPVSSARLTAGRAFTSGDAKSNVALVDADYAAQHKLRPGSRVTIGSSDGTGTSFKVVGVLRAPAGATPADVYLPLGRAQALAAAAPGGGNLKHQVNTVYVAASSAAEIGAAGHEISALLPRATVTTSGDLASQVSGSLASTASLADDLGKWLAAAVLIAAFLLASLLTLAAVSRRVREFGTLKALGWPSRRIVGQVMGESVAIGLAGAAAGVALGFAGAALVTRLAPPLSATVDQGPGQTGAGLGARSRILHNLAQASTHTVSVHLSAPVTVSVLVLAVLLAVGGGLLAGAFGGWRAARLRPAAALAQVG